MEDELVATTEAYTGIPIGGQYAHAMTPMGAYNARTEVPMRAYTAHAGTLRGAQAAHADTLPTDIERMFASVAATATKAYQNGLDARG